MILSCCIEAVENSNMHGKRLGTLMVSPDSQTYATLP